MVKPAKLDFVIQDAKVMDLKQIRDIYSYYVKESVTTLEENLPSEAQFLEVYEATLAKDLPFLVAKAGSQVVGYSYVLPFRKRSAYRYTLEDSIYIHKDFIGKGIGRALINELLKKCKAIGYKQMVSVVVADENQNSYNFHKAQGFEERGRLIKVGFKFGRWHDTILMQKEI
ncbi:MAG: GNAT family N-acetyltransferase [Rickettsiales bacterium]|nr:GNAT family N-acetyltransferase [Rickettsiales bacterium]